MEIVIIDECQASLTLGKKLLEDAGHQVKLLLPYNLNKVVQPEISASILSALEKMDLVIVAPDFNKVIPSVGIICLIKQKFPELTLVCWGCDIDSKVERICLACMGIPCISKPTELTGAEFIEEIQIILKLCLKIRELGPIGALDIAAKEIK